MAGFLSRLVTKICRVLTARTMDDEDAPRLKAVPNFQVPDEVEREDVVDPAEMTTLESRLGSLIQHNTITRAPAFKGICERVVDIKTRAHPMKCLTTFSETMGTGFIFERTSKIMNEHKNPKVLSEGLLWMVFAVGDFGVAHLKLKDVFDFCKDILKTVMASDSVSSVFGGRLDSLPREDNSRKITLELLKGLECSDWKVNEHCTISHIVDYAQIRLESIEAVNKIVEEANQRIQPTGTAQLYDSNQNLIMATLTSISGLESAMGPAIEKSSKVSKTFDIRLMGASSKSCEYVLSTLMQVFEDKRFAHAVKKRTLDNLITEILLWLLDERVPRMHDGSQLLKVLNVLMLRILDNAECTSSFVVLISLLIPLDPSRWPSPPSNESFATRNRKFSNLVVKCLIKLTKDLQSTIDEVDLDHILQIIHVYLQELGIDEIRRRVGARANDLHMLKTLLYELCKLPGTAIKGHLSMTLAAARMLTPTRPTGQTQWGDSMANNPMPAAHSVGPQLKIGVSAKGSKAESIMFVQDKSGPVGSRLAFTPIEPQRESHLMPQPLCLEIIAYGSLEQFVEDADRLVSCLAAKVLQKYRLLLL
ncbi:protein MOR1, partial [Tanacetum coccineum]